MRRVLLVALTAVILVGCGGKGETGRPDRVAGVYEAVLSEVARAEAPFVEGQPLPVIYAATSGTEAISAAAQVQVVKALKDQMELRFADERVEAIDNSLDGEPVHDDGLLVTLGPVPLAGTSFELPIELYRSASNNRSLVVTVTEGATGWTVSSVAPAG